MMFFSFLFCRRRLFLISYLVFTRMCLITRDCLMYIVISFSVPSAYFCSWR